MRQFLIGASALSLALAGGAAHAVPAPNAAMIQQVGNANTASANQTAAAGGTVRIQQVGNSNGASSTQGGTGNYDVTYQNGNGNGATNDSSGSANRSEIRQGCPASVCGSSLVTNNNTATVTQTGTSANNLNYVVQLPGTLGDPTGGNSVTVTQSGNGGNSGNPATTPNTPGGYTILNTDLEQYGTNSSITVGQAGANQQATVYQGVAYDTATNPPGVHIGTAPSSYDVYGATDNNSATVTQTATASFAQAYVYQGASDNVASATQYGVNQFSEIRQSTEESGISVGEGGNSATVTQDAGATSAISFVFQQGVGNTATVHQTLPNAKSNVYQSGAANTATVNQ